MRIIGVTGGIGSGKSTVSRYLAEKGAQIIDADQIAKDITAKGQEVLNELTEHFGRAIVNSDGSLNRKKLGEIAFGSKNELEALNNITHKHVAKEIAKSLNNIISRGNTAMVIIDAPIPIKHGFLDMVDEVWVVAADMDSRIKRVMSRSGFSYDEALRRVNSQMKDEDYFGIADHIIYNNGSEDELGKEIEKILLTGDAFGDKKTE